MTYRPDAVEYLRRVRALAASATPGPWYVRTGKDDSTVAASYISDVDGESWGWESPEHVVAITMYSNPPWAEAPCGGANEEFIVSARDDVPRLCDELEDALMKIDRLRVCLNSVLVESERHRAGLPQSSEGTEAIAAARRSLEWLEGPWWAAE